ncbi:hypothetical protein BDC45DRAFT_526539 [Circinella umbellata]|nr:hypothetical protein BDC45DRAFT_526539 [Circinella umbellata]
MLILSAFAPRPYLSSIDTYFNQYVFVHLYPKHTLNRSRPQLFCHFCNRSAIISTYL